MPQSPSSVRIRAALAAVVAAFAAPIAMAQSPSYFRHDGGLAADDEQPLADRLDAEHLVWKQALPSGHSSPTIVGDRIFLTGHDGDELATIGLDRLSGNVVWRQSIRVEQLEKFHGEGSPAAATVACDGKRVFAFFGSFGLLCYDLDGAPLWSKKLGPFRDEFGAASSPILVDDKLILNEDHDLDSFLLSVRQSDGETVWQTPRDGFTRSYATPLAWNVGGAKQLVVAGALQLTAYDPSGGRPLWSLDGFARIVNTTPIAAGGMLYVCTWSPGGDSDARIAMESWPTALTQWDHDKNGRIENEELPVGEVRARFFRIDLNGDRALDEAEWSKYARLFELAQNALVALRPGEGGTPPRIVWQYKRGLPYVSSPLVYRGHVFMIKDGGVMTLLDAETGKLVKQGRANGEGNYYASPVAGGGKIVVASGAGVVTILRAGPRAEIVATHDFSERIAATPAIVGGRLYVRTEKALYCFANR
jgi:outer membrane protein assembly factor BamB